MVGFIPVHGTFASSGTISGIFNFWPAPGDPIFIAGYKVSAGCVADNTRDCNAFLLEAAAADGWCQHFDNHPEGSIDASHGELVVASEWVWYNWYT